MSAADRDSKAAVLAANTEFYGAFTRGDFAAMRELWATEVEVLCIHPGSSVLRGSERGSPGAHRLLLFAHRPARYRGGIAEEILNRPAGELRKTHRRTVHRNPRRRAHERDILGRVFEHLRPRYSVPLS